MRSIRLLLVVIGIGSAGAVPRRADAADAATPKPDSPAGAIHCLARAFTDRSVEAYASLLSADYRFHFNAEPQVQAARFVDGLTRDEDLRSASGLFHGVVREGADAQAFGATRGWLRDGHSYLPGADSIRAAANGVSESRDPEHPDSSRHYQIVIVRRFEMNLHWANGKQTTILPNLHVFHVVRGDAAVRVEGQPADSARWYIRRWLEDVAGVKRVLADAKGDCGDPTPRPAAETRQESEGPGRPGVPAELAIHPLGNPACPALAIRCDFPAAEPARLEVFDVMGRLANRRELRVEAPGTMSLDAGAGARLEPGVYWVRLSQTARRPITKMVVVTRQ